MTIHELLSRLGKVKKTAGGYAACCPAHDDKNPSLSVAEKEGKILIKCFAGCATETVLAALGLEFGDLGAEARTFRESGRPYAALRNAELIAKTKRQSERREVRSYQYRDESGNVLYENVRYEPKDFRWRRRDDDGREVYNLGGVRLVPYRLPELLAEIARPEPEILLTEGEKDADNLAALGFATSSFKNWRPEFNDHIKGARVYLLRDHDKSGSEQAEAAALIVSDAARSVKVLDLYADVSDLRGQDFSDWFAERLGEDMPLEQIADRLRALCREAPDWKVPKVSKTKEPFRINAVTLEELYAEPEEQTLYVWDKTFPVGGLSIISAKPKVGKSTFARNLAVAISAGESFLGRDTTEGKILYLCLEEKLHEVRRQFAKMGAGGESILIHSGSTPKTTDEGIEAIGEAIGSIKPALVIVDPLSRMVRGADFNDYGLAYVLELFIDLARDSGAHICALHHDGKGDREGGDAILGSTAIFGAVDCHVSMKKRQNGRTIYTTQRYGEDLPETLIELDRETGVLKDKGDLQSAILAEVKTEVFGVIGSEALSQKDIKERLENRNGGLVSKAIKVLLEERTLERTGSGKKSDPFVYGRPGTESRAAFSNC